MFWKSLENHMLSDRLRSREVYFLEECTLEYIHWYLRVFHLYVQNPEFWSTYDVGQSSYTSATSMLDDSCLVGALGYLEPIVDHGYGSTPTYDNMYDAIEESVHLFRDLRVDLPVASKIQLLQLLLISALYKVFFGCKRHNSKLYERERDICKHKLVLFLKIHFFPHFRIFCFLTLWLYSTSLFTLNSFDFL